MGNEELSSAFGWVSIACWIVVYSPQTWENYQLQSGEGLSVAFVVVWLLGDLCNFVGATMAGLQTTVILLGIYYTLCDLILLVQIYYYRHKQRVHINPTPSVIPYAEDGEQAPLLGERTPRSPASASTTDVVSEADREGKKSEYGKATLRYVFALLFVFAVGTAAWLITRRDRIVRSPGDADGEKDVVEWRSQVIGWTSAVMYLASRIPQILKNCKTKCEGLSLALFMFSIAGNVTYVLSICTESMSARHLTANSSWLAGSGLTVFLDLFVLCQFFYFRREESKYIRVVNEAE